MFLEQLTRLLWIFFLECSHILQTLIEYYNKFFPTNKQLEAVEFHARISKEHAFNSSNTETHLQSDIECINCALWIVMIRKINSGEIKEINLFLQTNILEKKITRHEYTVNIIYIGDKTIHWIYYFTGS